jgi:2'-5' RNA ligase
MERVEMNDLLTLAWRMVELTEKAGPPGTISLWLDIHEAKEIALPGKGAVAPKDMHIVLANIPEISPNQKSKLKSLVKLLAMDFGPVQAQINQGARLKESGGMSSLAYKTDSPTLINMRQTIVERIGEDGIKVTSSKLMPHLVVRRGIGKDEIVGIPSPSAWPYELTLRNLVLTVGDERSSFDLSKGLEEKAGARHTKAENVKIQGMHDRAVELGARCDVVAKAGAKHNKKDRVLIQEIHDRAVSLGAKCEGGSEGIINPLPRSFTVVEAVRMFQERSLPQGDDSLQVLGES